MKKLIFAILVIVVSSCQVDDSDKVIYYSEAQKSAVDFLKGNTFVYTLTIGEWTHTTTIEFIETYDPPIEGSLESGGKITPIDIYGKYRITYDGSHTTPSSFDRYYWISLDADKLCSFARQTNINSTDIRDMQIIDDHTLKLKLPDDIFWETYIKQ